MKSRSVLLSSLAALLLFSACAGKPELTKATPSRVYATPEAKVYDATINAFHDLGLEVFEQQKGQGYIEGGRKPGFARGSETVGVWVKEIGPDQTRVSIENNRAIAGAMFAVDWTDKIFAEIDQELRGASAK